VLEIIPAQEIQPFWIRFTKGEFHPFSDWYRNFQYAREQERGLHHSEDARSIGKIHVDLEPGEVVHFILTTDLKSIKGSPLGWKEKEIQRLAAVSENAVSVFIADLMRSGDQFLVHRKSTNGSSVIAGYHWFTDWGRDTMISMRGLVIATGKKKMAESIFTTFLAYLDAGMIPNCFTDHGDKPEYNTMDGTLWLFVALYEYWLRFEDLKFIKKVFPRLTEILDAHRQGTRHHIHITKEGLLYGGETGSQLTWMDAMVQGKVVTPRIGCPVEINALWFNALSIYEVFANHLGEDIKDVTKQIKKHKKVFRHYFVNKKGYLNDVVIPGEEPDRSIRPNQIYAVSLPFSPLTKKESRHVLETVEKH
ncbi:MAG TPA: amylo-alpha-1,6-glucosidase, partial [Saprospiraceae bacterium]|nr:amylo-alpha-1,6-glucosidase [Saprospiraceae bacterium]